MSFQYFSKNGKILAAAEAVVPVANLEYAYGFGVYENIRVKNSRALFISDHIERLIASAKAIGLYHEFREDDIIKYCEELISKLETDRNAPLLRKGEGRVRSGTESFNLKILLIGAPDPSQALLYILPLSPFFPDKKLYSNGAKVISVLGERLFPNAKTLNMLQSYLAYKQAKAAHCYDALLINKSGCITEGTRTNFFVIRGREIYGAPESEILCGVTRKYVLQVARENGYEPREANIKLNQLGEYDGAFLTSTSSKIVPLKQIDDFIYPEISDEIKNLIKLFNNYLDN